MEVERLSLKQGQVFEVMACAYRHDVLDKGMSILGDAIDGMMREEDMKIGDLVNRLDEAQEQTVMKINAVLARSGPLLRLAATDTVMSLTSRLLSVRTVRNAMVSLTRRALSRALRQGEGPATSALDTGVETAVEGVRV